MSKESSTVVYICPNGFIGGAERFVLNAAAGHIKHGNCKPIILFFKNGDAVLEAKKNNIQVHVLKNKFRLLNPIKLYRAIRELRSYFIESKPDFIHATMAYGYIVTWLATIFLPFKKLWFQHGPVNNILDLIATQLPVEYMAYNSYYLKKLHHKNPRLLSRAPKGEYIIHLGIPEINLDSKKLEDLQKKFCNDNKFIFLSAGRITPCKGYETIIHAINSLIKTKKTYVENIKILIIGSPTNQKDHRYQEDLHQLVKDYSLSDNVVFLPFQNDIHHYYSLADCFIQASNIPEPFGLTAAEAMKQGILTIGCNEGGITEILKNKVTGYTFSSASALASTELAKLIEHVIHNKEQGKHLAKAGQNLVNEKLTIKSMIESLENIYLN